MAHNLRRTAATVVLLLSLGATGCTQFDPKPDAQAVIKDSFVVLAQGEDPEQLVLAQLYAQALERSGRSAEVRVNETGADSLAPLIAGDADLSIACAGSLLAERDPQRAKELEATFRKQEEKGEVPVNSGEWREETYAALVASLVPKVDAGDPSNALGCQDVETLTPQNIVPIYRVPVFERSARLVLNEVTGTISTEDVQLLVEEIGSGTKVEDAVSRYLDSQGI